MPSSVVTRRVWPLGLAAAAALACGPQGTPAQAPRALTDSAFAALSARLSEPGGYFDTDNLISNEDSYLHAVSLLRKAGTRGGTYVGVGPDQNFSYIAAVRPDVAFIVDIRRDNLLEHLLFKGIFALARNRADYLALLFGRVTPSDTVGAGALPVDSLLAQVGRARPDPTAAERVLARAAATGIPLTRTDSATVRRFHRAFMDGGPSLQFNSFGRAPQPQYPDFARLAAERDREGRQASFLASEDAFAVVRDLQRRNLLVPVVGDFAGAHAFRGVGDWMRAHDQRLAALYASNVEFYLFRSGTFGAFAANVERLPRDHRSVVIRSCFACRFDHPQRMSGYSVVQLVQFVDRFGELRAAGQLASYSALVTAGLLQP